MTIKLIVAGACGKMAGQVLALAVRDASFQIAGAFEAPGHPAIGRRLGDVLGLAALRVPVSAGVDGVIDKGDVLIDFTHRDAAPAHIRACLRGRKAVVIGTTGLADSTLRSIKSASQKIPIVQSPNMSAGVNLMFKLVELMSSKLSDEYDVEIVESHHRHKKDAPSGTALALARRVAEGRKASLDRSVVYGRRGLAGERKRGTIGIHAIRGGDVVGDHTVSFMSEGERLELTHRASSREAFAKGALLAAKFVVRKKSGLYSMQDVLGL